MTRLKKKSLVGWVGKADFSNSYHDLYYDKEDCLLEHEKAVKVRITIEEIGEKKGRKK